MAHGIFTSEKIALDMRHCISKHLQNKVQLRKIFYAQNYKEDFYFFSIRSIH